MRLATLGDGERAPCFELLRVNVLLGDAVREVVDGRERAAAAIGGRKGRGGEVADAVSDVVRLNSKSDRAGLIWNSSAVFSMISRTDAV